MFIVQAGIFLLAGAGFVTVYVIFRKNGHHEFSELVEESAEEENDSLRDVLREENTEHN